MKTDSVLSNYMAAKIGRRNARASSTWGSPTIARLFPTWDESTKKHF